MRMPKQPTAAQIKKAQAVLAWFAVTHDMAARTDDALIYANAITKLDADMVRVAKEAAQSAYESGRTGPAYFTPRSDNNEWTVEYRPDVIGSSCYELKEGNAHRGLFPSTDAAEREAHALGAPVVRHLESVRVPRE